MTIEKVDLYRMKAEEIARYLPGKDCGACGRDTCLEFADAIKEADIRECPHIAPRVVEALEGSISIEMEMEEGDSTMATINRDLIEINSPTMEAPVLVTGNSRLTIYVLETILSRTDIAAFILPTDTKGFTIDHAAGMRLMTPQTVMRAVVTSEIASRVGHRNLIIPGLCSGIERSIQQMTRWNVTPGPKSGFELPAYLLKNSSTEE